MVEQFNQISHNYKIYGIFVGGSSDPWGVNIVEVFVQGSKVESSFGYCMNLKLVLTCFVDTPQH